MRDCLQSLFFCGHELRMRRCVRVRASLLFSLAGFNYSPLGLCNTGGLNHSDGIRGMGVWIQGIRQFWLKQRSTCVLCNTKIKR